MGTKQSQNINSSKYGKIEKISRNHFEFLYVIGKGGFGKVWRVNSKKNKKSYALKEMSKVKIIDRKSEKSIIYERDLLSKLKHPFIVNMNCSFQDYENLYLVMDLLTGGDLRYHISRQRKFNEEQTKFFVACIILGLDYVHSKKVIHRDIKPENLVLDDRGYLRITDFGVAKVLSRDNSSETSGTPGYMAPEVMCAQNHSFPVDYFAIGVIAFEFMYGTRPYLGKSRKEIKDLILSKQVQIRKNEIPENWSIEAADFVNKLLQRKPAQRLGINGIKELKEHCWFKDFTWDALYKKEMTPPYVPRNGDNFDKKYCEGIDKVGNETYERYQIYYKTDNFNEVFKNYTYIDLSDLKEVIEKENKINASNTSTPTRSILLNKPSTITSTNLNFKTKVKIVDNPSNKNQHQVGSPLINSTPNRTLKKVKSNSISSINFSQYNTKSIYNSNITKLQSTVSVNSPIRFVNSNSSNVQQQLPFIQAKNSIKGKIQKNVVSNSNKLTNSSSSNSIIKNSNKFSTISSQGLTTSLLHKRSGSTNYFQ